MLALTGGTGFIGSALARRLRHSGYAIRALVRSPQKANALTSLGIEVVLGELDENLAVRRLLRGASAVVHCAGAVRGRGWLDFARVNQLQRAVNICFGSAVATIGLIMPAVLVASTMVGLPIELGLEPAEIALLALTLAISIVTFVGTRTNSLQGLYTWQPS